ncbi:SH3-domain-containing membrane protein [Mycena sanguinolenta]|uniref:SH3-domain-containing membrane protein n=1 Tax=Mycena sanguinolenta TaxID=230812 RepID=A0A8H7CSP8_9AGAR|nr:SH3-domain-containing membrane protein [Mycena sanguinolenta]
MPEEQDTRDTHLGQHYHFATILGNYFYASTVLVTSAAWVVAFAAQIAVTKLVGHEAVGVMWFAVFLQLFLNLGVVGILAGGDIGSFRLQACALSTMAGVFAVIGVDMSIFAGQPARSAMAAGWLLLAIVDILWMLFFSAEPQTPFARLVESMTVGSTDGPEDADRERQASSARSSKAKRWDPTGLPGSETKVGHDARGEAPPESSPEIDWTGMGRKRIVDSPQNIAAEMPETAPNHSFPPPTSNNRRAVYLEGRQLSTIYDRTEGTSEDANSQRNTELPNQFPFKVRARSNWIPRSPSEISFKKGDILYSAENEGKKWWKVKKADGTVGSAPSNYFKVLNS